MPLFRLAKIIGFNTLVITTLLLTLCPSNASNFRELRESYARHVYESYSAAHQDALALRNAISDLLEHSDEPHLQRARSAWITARDSYSQTEAFRFYEGPIDGLNKKTGRMGPESRINSWPVNEAYLEQDRPGQRLGIINDPSQPITATELATLNQQNDEADVATGYHAIEFLLWGADHSDDGPGARPASQFLDAPTNIRRRQYLLAVTNLLIRDLASLKTAWAPHRDNYARAFVERDTAQADILTGLATLSGFEMAAERLATGLDSGDQEDEQSCFSDTTLRDFRMNQRGIEAAFTGPHSFMERLEKEKPNLARDIQRQFSKVMSLLDALPSPYDSAVLAAPPDSDARHTAEELVTALQQQAKLFEEVGAAYGLPVHIMSD